MSTELRGSPGMPLLIRQAWRDLWRCLPDLLLFDLFFRMLTFVVLAPLLAGVVQWLIARSGRAAIGNFDVAGFLLTPLGAATALVFAVLLGTILWMQWAGLMSLGYGARLDRRLRYADALRLVTRRFPRILALSLLFSVLSIVVLAILVVPLALVGKALLSQHDINYYLDARPPEFWAALGLGGGFAALAVVALGVFLLYLVMAMPSVILQDTGATRAFRTGRRLAKGRTFRVARALLTWLIGWALVSLVLHSVLHGVCLLVGGPFDRHVRWLALVLGTFAAGQFLLSYVLTFVAQTMACLLVVRLHAEACFVEDQELPPLSEFGQPLAERPDWTVPRKLPLGIALMVFGVTVAVTVGLLESLQMQDRVGVTAHRGGARAAPENTLAAFRRGIQDGATHLELDVQRTADGIVVVAHDADLMRVASSPLVVSDTTYADLSQTDVGGRFGNAFRGEKIATLSQAIDLARGRVALLVELKSYRGDKHRLIQQVVQTIQASGMKSQTAVISLKYDELLEVKRLDPSLRTGLLASAKAGDLTKLEVDFLAVSRTLATDTLIASAHACGKQVYVWTIDDPKEASSLIDRGVDNIITDDTSAIVRLLAERADLSDTERILLRFRHLYWK